MCECCDLLSGEFRFLNEEMWLERHLNDYSIVTEETEIDINYCPKCRTKTSRKLAEDGRK